MRGIFAHKYNSSNMYVVADDPMWPSSHIFAVQSTGVAVAMVPRMDGTSTTHPSRYHARAAIVEKEEVHRKTLPNELLHIGTCAALTLPANSDVGNNAVVEPEFPYELACATFHILIDKFTWRNGKNVQKCMHNSPHTHTHAPPNQSASIADMKWK